MYLRVLSVYVFYMNKWYKFSCAHNMSICGCCPQHSHVGNEALASLLSTPEPLLAALASEAQRNRAQILFEANRA